jgi:hypothetical protein
MVQIVTMPPASPLPSAVSASSSAISHICADKHRPRSLRVEVVQGQVPVDPASQVRHDDFHRRAISSAVRFPGRFRAIRGRWRCAVQTRPEARTRTPKIWQTLPVVIPVAIIRFPIATVAARVLIIVATIAISIPFCLLAAHLVVAATLIRIAIIGATAIQEPLRLPHQVVVIGSRWCSGRYKWSPYQ